MSFGERLRELREEKGMTQEDLGNLLGVSGRQAGNYESNKQFLRDEESFLKIIKYFDVSADYLFGLSNERNYNLSNERNYNKMFADLECYKDMPSKAKLEVKDYIKYLISKYSQD